MPTLLSRTPDLHAHTHAHTHTHTWLRMLSYWIGLVLFDQMPLGGRGAHCMITKIIFFSNKCGTIEERRGRERETKNQTDTRCRGKENGKERWMNGGEREGAFHWESKWRLKGAKGRRIEGPERAKDRRRGGGGKETEGWNREKEGAVKRSSHGGEVKNGDGIKWKQTNREMKTAAEGSGRLSQGRPLVVGIGGGDPFGLQMLEICWIMRSDLTCGQPPTAPNTERTPVAAWCAVN